MRRNSGERHYRAKLTDAQVRDMRRTYWTWLQAGARKGYGTLALIYGCGESTARDIVLCRTRRA